MSKVQKTKSGRSLGMRTGAALLAFAASVGIGVAAHAQAPVTDAEARQIALARVPGTAVHVEREVEHGRRIVEVHVRDATGRIMGIEIDELTRAIVTVEQEEADESGDAEHGEHGEHERRGHEDRDAEEAPAPRR